MSTLEELLTRVIDAKLEQAKKEFSHQVTMQAELTHDKLDLIVEGQQMLVERMDRMEERLDGRIDQVEKRLCRVEAKVDAVAVDLADHRRDTEAHRKGWRVREEGGGEVSGDA